MTYRVRWSQAALDELAAAWVAADSALREQITAVSQDLEDHLRRDPLGCSESRFGGRRILIVSPLSVIFEIDFSKDLVSVLHFYCAT